MIRTGKFTALLLALLLLLNFDTQIVQACEIDNNGWTDVRELLVKSDGSHSLGNNRSSFNTTRDQGSKIVYFDTENGDNETADAYWWDGENIVDLNGSTTNPENGEIYGTDPLTPNENAIKPFKNLTGPETDPRLLTQKRRYFKFEYMAAGYPDWFLFKRGQKHSKFSYRLAGGRSEAEPMVAAAYGPLSDGRAIIDADIKSPVEGPSYGAPEIWFHRVLVSLEIRNTHGHADLQNAISANGSGGPVTDFLEDCYFTPLQGYGTNYPAMKTTYRRCIIEGRWNPKKVQGHYTYGFKNQVKFEETIFYRNGFSEDPLKNADPKRNILARNVYQGGGAKMGYVYDNVISANGASGGPQMRFGGTMQNSLILEGYMYSSTVSNINNANQTYHNEWLENEGQVGQSAVIRNNVQLIYAYPTPMDPDTDGSSSREAQPGWGYSLSGSSFGSIVEGNIISGAMLEDDLGKQAMYGLQLAVDPMTYKNGQVYAQLNNVIRNNISYRVKEGLRIHGDATGTVNDVVTDNIFVSDYPINKYKLSNLNTADQISVKNNRFYSKEELPTGDWVQESNVLNTTQSAIKAEGWSDPDRTLKRYVKEVLHLSLLDWDDDPYLDVEQKSIRMEAGEVYDPTGLKTFMAVATHMRHGGVDLIPTDAKPSITGDYPWDERFTAKAVVNWIRAGFNMDPVEN